MVSVAQFSGRDGTVEANGRWGLQGGCLLVVLLAVIGCEDASRRGAYADFNQSVPTASARPSLHVFPLSQTDSTDTPPYYYMNVYEMGGHTFTVVNGMWMRAKKKRIWLGDGAPTERILRKNGNRITAAVMPGMVPVEQGEHADSLRPATVDEVDVTVTVRKSQTKTGNLATATIVATKTLEDVIRRQRADSPTPVTFPIEIQLTFDLDGRR